MTKLKKELFKRDNLILIALFIIILLLILIFIRLTPSILNSKNLQTKITINPSITPNINDIINIKIPELQANNNIVKLKGKDADSFTIYINPPGRGFGQTNVINEAEVEINNTKYKKTLLFNPSNKKVDIILNSLDNQNSLNIEIVANIDKEDVSLAYGYKIIKALQE